MESYPVKEGGLGGEMREVSGQEKEEASAQATARAEAATGYMMEAESG